MKFKEYLNFHPKCHLPQFSIKGYGGQVNPKQIQMAKIQNSKQYDLEERTFLFAQRVKEYVKKLPRTLPNIEYGRQLIRSSGSQAANYIEANESLGKKDFQMRIKICRKESKESRLWLKLTEPLEGQIKEREELIAESLELTKIFGSILENYKNKI